MVRIKKPIRLIARLDVKGSNLIKGIHLEGLRIIGSPEEYALKYYMQGADEIIYMDIVASLYGRSNLREIVSQTARNIFIPMTVGGGIRSIEDVAELLRAGADKVAINTAAIKNPQLITDVSTHFGAQCMVLSVEAKRQPNGKWFAYTDCGRESSGIEVVDWVRQGVERGAGEVMLTSIDREGTKKGFDINLAVEVTSSVDVPVILSGGYGAPQHLVEALKINLDGLVFASGLHYAEVTIHELRNIAIEDGAVVRSL